MTAIDECPSSLEMVTTSTPAARSADARRAQAVVVAVAVPGEADEADRLGAGAVAGAAGGGVARRARPRAARSGGEAAAFSRG